MASADTGPTLDRPLRELASNPEGRQEAFWTALADKCGSLAHRSTGLSSGECLSRSNGPASGQAACVERIGREDCPQAGDNPINFVSVTDVAALVEHAVTDPATRGRILEISGPEDLTLNQLAAAVQEAAGRTSPPRHVPPLVLRIMARTAGRLKPELGRQARAALLMDGTDLTYDTADIRQAYPDIPSTPLDMCLGPRTENSRS